jgi:inner membrane protein involved in colicin E2 resistance
VTVVLVLGVLSGRSLHPMNYFFLSAAFFAFHLLLAYLVDHVNIHAACLIASVTSIALVVSYLRLVAGTSFAVLQATARIDWSEVFARKTAPNPPGEARG